MPRAYSLLSLPRQLVGPVVILAALWCAGGQVTVATASSAAVRVAVPPALTLFGALGSVALVVCIAGWRRSAWTAMPAALAIVPWLPGPWPPVALVWTGPLAYLPILCAAALALAVHPPWATLVPPADPSGRVDDNSGVRSAALAGALALAISTAVAWQLAPRLPGGDEPHYLVITQSLLRDADIKIQNNHDRGDYREYYGGDLRPDYIPLPQVKDIYSIHAPGLAVAVLPGFAIAGYRGAQVTIIALAALAASLIWLAAFELTRARGAAWMAWAATTTSLTFLIQSVTIFPDGAGMAAVAAGVWLYVRLGRSGRQPSLAVLAVVGAALAALPWLHSRFAVLAAGLGLVILWRVLRSSAATEGAARAAAFLAVPAASAVFWLMFFKTIYGTFNPSAPYGAQPVTFLGYVPGGLAALLVDQQFGLLTFAPVFALGLAALAAREARATLAIAIAYLAASASYWMWWAGVPAPPARLATATLPLLALPVALAWARAGTALRAISAAALGAGAVMATALIAIDHGVLAWDVRGPAAAWLAWLGPTVALARGWPSFFWDLTPGEVATEIAFARHAVAWVAVWMGAAIAFVRIARVWPQRRIFFAAAWWLPLTLMLAVQSGWWIDRAPVLRPLRSQLHVLRATAHDTPGLRLSGALGQPFLGATAAGLRLRAGVPVQESDEEKWETAVLDDVPAGVYELHVSSRRPVRGALHLRAHPRDAPFTTLAIAPLSQQQFVVQLPVALEQLVLEPDQTLKKTGGYVEVVPVVIPPPGARAVRAASSPAGSVFFLDDEVFLEDDAFWVRGGKTAEVVVVASDGRTGFELDLGNGAAANDVVVTTDAGASPLTLAPSESRTLSVPVPLTTRAVKVRISSPAGFVPAQVGNSQDGRNLGVRVRVR